MGILIFKAVITGVSIITNSSPYLPIPSKQTSGSAIEAINAGTAEINLSAIAIHMDRYVRVGLRDDVYIEKRVLEKSNTQSLVKFAWLIES